MDIINVLWIFSRWRLFSFLYFMKTRPKIFQTQRKSKICRITGEIFWNASEATRFGKVLNSGKVYLLVLIKKKVTFTIPNLWGLFISKRNFGEGGSKVLKILGQKYLQRAFKKSPYMRRSTFLECIFLWVQWVKILKYSKLQRRSNLVTFKPFHPAFTCSKLTIETVAQGIFIVNFEHISHRISHISIVNFVQVNAGWM